jgi:hypothetical protein
VKTAASGVFVLLPPDLSYAAPATMDRNRGVRRTPGCGRGLFLSRRHQRVDPLLSSSRVEDDSLPALSLKPPFSNPTRRSTVGEDTRFAASCLLTRTYTAWSGSP